jgi:hypothetical protein
MSEADAFKLRSWLRQNWWLAWSLLVSAYAGQTCFYLLLNHDFPSFMFFPMTIGVPIYFSRLIAFSYLQLKEWWQVVVLPFVAASLALLLLWPTALFTGGLHVFNLGQSEIFLFQASKFFLILFAIDLFVAFAGQIFYRRVIWRVALIDLVIIWWIFRIFITMTATF